MLITAIISSLMIKISTSIVVDWVVFTLLLILKMTCFHVISWSLSLIINTLIIELLVLAITVLTILTTILVELVLKVISMAVVKSLLIVASSGVALVILILSRVLLELLI